MNKLVQPYTVELSEDKKSMKLTDQVDTMKYTTISSNWIKFALENISDKEIISINLELPHELIVEFDVWKMKRGYEFNQLVFYKEIVNITIPASTYLNENKVGKVPSIISLSGENIWKPGEYIYFSAVYAGNVPSNGAVTGNVETAPYPTFVPPVTTQPFIIPPVSPHKTINYAFILPLIIGVILAIIVGIYFYMRNKTYQH